jgi:hypothetical protein
MRVLARKDEGAGTFAARSFGGCVGIKKRNLDLVEAQLPCAGGIQTTTGGSKNMCDSNYPGLLILREFCRCSHHRHPAT